MRMHLPRRALVPYRGGIADTPELTLPAPTFATDNPLLAALAAIDYTIRIATDQADAVGRRVQGQDLYCLGVEHGIRAAILPLEDLRRSLMSSYGETPGPRQTPSNRLPLQARSLAAPG